MKTIKLVLIAGILWAGFATNGGPFGLPHFGPDSAFAGKNGNGNGNLGRSRSGKSNNNRVKIDAVNAHQEKSPNLSAELKGLNSLNRNINGLLNSSDPKMDDFRELVENGGEPTDAELLEAMQSAFGEPPTSDWSAEAVSWVRDHVNDFITTVDEINAEQTTAQNTGSP